MIDFIKANPRDRVETNDCSVRAVSVASGLPYYKVHAAFAEAGRKAGNGVSVRIMIAALEKLGIMKQQETLVFNRPTLSYWLSNNPTGNWVIVKRDHAFAILDGVVHDSSPVGARSRVLFAFKVNT
jgi:hypothetical protein